jgi:CHASE2 domain-containing sensor protein
MSMEAIVIALYLLAPAAAQAATVVKDPMSYPVSQYGFMLALSLLGGFVSWYAKVKRGELVASNLMSLVGELSTSALAGLLAFYVCEWLDVVPVLTAALVGVSGHMGTRGITLAEETLQHWIEKRTKP